jgi:outer membrane protein TolC
LPGGPEPVAPADRPVLAVDLPTALALADSRNPRVALAREQIREAYALQRSAEVLWLPSIRGGANYYKHEGAIQAVDGTVFNTSRGAFFAGSGAGIYGAGPPIVQGVVSSFHFSDALFRPLAARQFARAQGAAARATANDMLFEVSLAYLELLRAAQDEAIAGEVLDDSQKLSDVTAAYARTGQGLRSDADRALANLMSQRIQLERASEASRVASARLAQVLRLDPSLILVPADTVALPLEIVPEDVPLRELVAQGLSNRPELAQSRALVSQAVARLRREQYAPLVPSVLVGTTYGTFGGGLGSQLTNTNARFSVDALAWWELRNLGAGDQAARSAARSQLRQAELDRLATMDRVAREVVEAQAQVQYRRRQIAIAQRGVAAALASYRLNMQRIEHAQGLPIEALQSIQALAQSRRDYLRAVIDYDAAQFALQRALGGSAPRSILRGRPPRQGA